MKTAFVVENGVITNAIVVDDDTDLSVFNAVVFPETYIGVGIGCSYVNGVVKDQSGNVIEPLDQLVIDTQKANDELQAKLKKINSIGFLEWEDLGSEKQAAVRAYKQELLDVPNQAGFPNSINWPVNPLITPTPTPA